MAGGYVTKKDANGNIPVSIDVNFIWLRLADELEEMLSDMKNQINHIRTAGIVNDVNIDNHVAKLRCDLDLMKFKLNSY